MDRAWLWKWIECTTITAACFLSFEKRRQVYTVSCIASIIEYHTLCEAFYLFVNCSYRDKFL